MMVPATSFIDLGRSNQNDGIIEGGRFAIDQALRSIRIPATYDTYRMDFIDQFGSGHEIGHWPERLATKISVKTGANNP
jgi:hypothetical protein